MKKVYCKNCRHLCKVFRNNCCIHPVHADFGMLGGLDGVKGGKDILEINKNNNCSYYDRKWWKFWV